MSRGRHVALGIALVLAAGLQIGGCRDEIAWPAVDHAIRTGYPDVQRVTTDSLARWIASDSLRKPVLLDTRPVEEFTVSHLQGAVRIDPDAEDFSMLDTLSSDAPIVTYCSVGYRSSGVAERLQAAGFTNVRNLEGSIFGWANEGRPVYRDGREVHEVHPFDAVWGSLLDPELRAYEPGDG
jgi:rhodanese-related sulfurtransferase